MDIRITPALLNGEINIPPSKSISHRALIAAALAKGESRIYNLLDCVDTVATIEALTALGATIEKKDNCTIVKGIEHPTDYADINCHESGSTLRFIIPIAAALGINCVFRGEANLPNRPITPYFSELTKHGISFSTEKMPYNISGRLTGGVYEIAGNISSQFITGFLFALALLNEDSVIKLTSPLESKPYVDLTIDTMKAFGVTVEEYPDEYRIKGGQNFTPCEYHIEADMSQAAFFLVGKAIGGNIETLGLNQNSRQGDKEIITIVHNFLKNRTSFKVDATQIPDLVPILTVLACFAKGTSHIYGCERLRIKESDRLATITEELNKLGADIRIIDDSLYINGVNRLHGGECFSHTDHRIAMSLAIASQRCTEPIVIKGADCVTKSYPTFFEDFRMLGGIADVI